MAYRDKREKMKYDLWKGMINRCYKPGGPSYQYYGAKGIRVCERWLKSHSAFWQDMGERPDGMTLDRIDSTKDYSPENCKWATITEQNNNKGDTRLITWRGRMQNMTAWAKELGMSPAALHYRLTKMKLPVDIAFTAPVTRSNSRRRFLDIK